MADCLVCVSQIQKVILINDTCILNIEILNKSCYIYYKCGSYENEMDILLIRYSLAVYIYLEGTSFKTTVERAKVTILVKWPLY